MSKTQEERIMRLEAECKELRSLWIETEGDIIQLKVKLDVYLNEQASQPAKRKWWQL